MKERILNKVISLLAIIGVIVFVGIVGKVDYVTTVGGHFSLLELAKMLFLGIVLIIPAIIREVI